MLRRAAVVVALAALALFYTATMFRVLLPRVDVVHRDLFISPILTIDPRLPKFGPDGGLAARPGAWIDLAQDRRHLARFDWATFWGQSAMLADRRGRLLIRLPSQSAPADTWRLTLAFRCTPLAAARDLVVSVGGVEIGTAPCGPEDSSTTLAVPTKLLAPDDDSLVHIDRPTDYVVIEIAIPPETDSFVARWRRLLRLDVVEFLGFRLEPAGSLVG